MKTNFNCEICNDYNWSICKNDDNDIINLICRTCFKNHIITEKCINKQELLDSFSCENCGSTNGNIIIERDCLKAISIVCSECQKKHIIIETPKRTSVLPKTHKESPVKCPKCGSTQITAGARGVNALWGFVGASKTVNRCMKCGHSWTPHK